MGIILKKSNKTSFVLLETLMALSITASCIFLVSYGNVYLLKKEKNSDLEIRVIRRLYEDVKTYRIHHKLPIRTMEDQKSQTIIIREGEKIQKVKIIQGEKVIEIEKIHE
ncbi:MAG: hypothetical protein IC227_10155 [Enterococcus lacertideformus]|uniref:Uncharacterized protein n=1 Tax=Enterococcus lacertideformus TaxID=2771493 RepID=A0A931AWH8_9ENTE|nr:hypothetical protein [Enterococcus lacertideformus]